MADPRDLRGRWSWQVAGFEARPPSTDDDEEVLEIAGVTNTNNMNISSRYSTPTMPPKQSLMYAKVQQLNEEVLAAREEFLELRQEASDLQEYSNAKLGRVMRYLGVLAEKARKLDRIALETESRIAPLIMERKKLFNDLLSIRGNIRVFCRVRPQFEDEGSPATEFPDVFTIRINPGGDPVTSSKRDYEFDRVYGPHVGQGFFFQDVQPFIQSALDGYNVTIFAYGQTGSGKTHTMEGSSHDRGVYFRAFEEIFDLSNADATASSKFYFYVTIFTLHNEQIYDLLATSSGNLSRINMGMPGFSVEVVQEKVENPTDFSRVMKLGLQNQGRDNLNVEQHKRSHLIVTIHIHCSSSITGQSHYSKLSLVDLAGSEHLPKEETKGENLTELLHVNKSLSALGDVVCALTAQKDHVPYGNSRLTQILSDSLGGDSKTLIIVNVSPTSADVRETISSLNFAARARNVELSLGNRDTIKKWRDMANEARKEVFEKEKEVTEANQEIMTLKKQLQEADNQSLLLFSEVQKAWKVAFALQADLKAESVMLQEQHKIEKAQNEQLRNQIAQLMKVEQEEKIHLVESKTMIQTLEAKVKEFEWKLSEVQAERRMDKGDTDLGQGPVSISNSQVNNGEKDMTNLSVTRKLEEELAKRDKLIERLHEENEKLFERLTNRSVPEGSPKVASKNSGEVGDLHLDVSVRKGNSRSISPDQRSLSSGGTLALVKSNSHKIKTTPAGEYLTAALMDFNPDQYENLATVADGANKLLMLVLAAVIKAGAAREHEMLAEIQDSVFSFIRKMEPRRVMDTMLVSRVRILYIRSLLSRSPELQAIKIPPVEHFLEKASTGHSRNSSRGSSPGRSPGQYYQNSSSVLLDEHIRAFKVNIRQDKKSKFSSIVLKLRGIDQETWRQHVTGGKLREITEEARTFATGNKALAALFVHTPAGELQRQIRAWLAQNFNFLSVTGGDSVGGVAGQLELLSTAIMDGWMAGLGTPQHPSTDALGQLLSNYTKRIYTSQLQHLKDIAGTLATEEADDLPSITKLRSALESVEHKRRKILLQVRTDIALLTKERGGSPVQNPSTAAEDARLASLISLEDILRQMEDIKKEAFEKPITAITKKALLEALNELLGRMPSLLSIDHPCAQRHIKDAYKIIENIEPINDNLPASIQSAENEVVQWSVLQFNTGSTAPFVIKCGATSNSELVVKAQAKFQESSHEIVAIVPKPSVLANMSMEEMKQILSQLPESLCELASARTADGTRARYSRLYRTLAMRVPSMKNSINELEKDESSRDVVNPSTPSNRSTQFQRSAESHNMSEVTQ